ncbi:MAG: glycoside hydrolase family 43 protein [Eubacteriales bacterium]|nr:glycoside hydrolase family 43 protein [Eubacteriales bacterium]
MEKYFHNPILSGFHSDPSICRVGEDYYLVTSTFVYFPGLPVFHSKDLIHWEHIGNAIERSDQIDFSKSAFSEGLWAPTIRWNDGIFYIVNTLVQEGREAIRLNFIVTAKDPAGPWSDPIVIQGADGIDSSLFFDDDGRLWYCGNFIGEEVKYEGHQGIYLNEMDPETLQFIGKRKVILDGASIRGKWTESPHIYKKDGYYYLMISEGGTFTNHCVMMFRSKTIDGEYEVCLRNPILSHRHLPLSYPIVATGHSDLVVTQNGEWWMVLLGVRPYSGFNYNLGRETFLVPLRWEEDGFPLVDTPDGLVDEWIPCPDLPPAYPPPKSPAEHFERKNLSPDWCGIRSMKRDFYSLEERPGCLRIRTGKEKLSDFRVTPCFLGKRQEHMYFGTGTFMEFCPQENEEAGIALVQSDEFHYIYTVTRKQGRILLQLYQNENAAAAVNYDFDGRMIKRTDVAVMELPAYEEYIYLYVQGTKDQYHFYYGFTEGEYILFAKDVDGTLLSTTRAGGFVGTFVGVYASANGEVSENHADYHWFENYPTGTK